MFGSRKRQGATARPAQVPRSPRADNEIRVLDDEGFPYAGHMTVSGRFEGERTRWPIAGVIEIMQRDTGDGPAFEILPEDPISCAAAEQLPAQIAAWRARETAQAQQESLAWQRQRDHEARIAEAMEKRADKAMATPARLAKLKAELKAVKTSLETTP